MNTFGPDSLVYPSATDHGGLMDGLPRQQFHRSYRQVKLKDATAACWC